MLITMYEVSPWRLSKCNYVRNLLTFHHYVHTRNIRMLVKFSKLGTMKRKGLKRNIEEVKIIVLIFYVHREGTECDSGDCQK